MRGVFNSTPVKKHQPKNKYKIGHSIKLLPVDDILNARISREVLEAVQPLSQLPDDYFQICYVDLVKQFAAVANVLPMSLHDGLGSLYCRSLYSAYYTLKLFVQDTPQADCLWRYAVFSAALLKHCSVVAKLFQVIITDSEGSYLNRWNPYSGPLMNDTNQYCKLYSLNTQFAQNHAIITGMMITQIMPSQALQWLQTQSDVFVQWLDCLQSEFETSGVLGDALERLSDETDLILQQDEKLKVEMVETPDTLPGEALDQWIRDGIENGDIKVNTPDSPIHIVRDGLTDLLFIEQGVSRDFHEKLAMFSTSTAAAVAMASAIFNNNDQHSLIFSMPGLGRRQGLMGGLSTESNKLKMGTFRDPGAYFSNTPAKSSYAQTSNKSLANAQQSLKNIVEGQTTELHHRHTPKLTPGR